MKREQGGGVETDGSSERGWTRGRRTRGGVEEYLQIINVATGKGQLSSKGINEGGDSKEVGDVGLSSTRRREPLREEKASLIQNLQILVTSRNLHVLPIVK